MQKTELIELRFRPLPKESILESSRQLYQALEQKKLLLSHTHTQKRRDLAKKLLQLRSKMYLKLKQNAASRLEQKLSLASIELQKQKKLILDDCQRQALKTIENVCLAAFSESIELNQLALQRSIDAAFQALEPNQIIKLALPAELQKNFSAYPLHSENAAAFTAKIFLKTGCINIDPIESLERAFAELSQKLEISLHSQENHDLAV
jgi:hypothetical protein